MTRGVRNNLTEEEVTSLKTHLSLDSNGVPVWAVDIGKKIKQGAVAGGETADGYHRIGLHRKLFQTHIVVWVLTHGVAPDSEIDHINGVKSDNRIENLRLVTHAENHRNRRIPSNNKSGAVGVLSPKNSPDKFQARIRIPDRSRNIVIGTFNTFRVAVLARQFMQVELGYHRLHGLEPVKIEGTG